MLTCASLLSRCIETCAEYWPAANLSLYSLLSESDRYGLLAQIAIVLIPQGDELIDTAPLLKFLTDPADHFLAFSFHSFSVLFLFSFPPFPSQLFLVAVCPGLRFLTDPQASFVPSLSSSFLLLASFLISLSSCLLLCPSSGARSFLKLCLVGIVSRAEAWGVTGTTCHDGPVWSRGPQYNVGAYNSHTSLFSL